MRRRREWFERIENHMVMWRVAPGTEPTVDEAKERLEHLQRHGPSPHAFTFKRRFPPEATNWSRFQRTSSRAVPRTNDRRGGGANRAAGALILNTWLLPKSKLPAGPESLEAMKPAR